MALNSLFLTRLIATIKRLTKDLLVTVYVSQFISVDGYGQPVYGAATAYRVALDLETKVVISSGAQEVVNKGKILFLEAVPVTTKDRIQLPDGSTPAIANVESPVSADGSPLITLVTFGAATASR